MSHVDSLNIIAIDTNNKDLAKVLQLSYGRTDVEQLLQAQYFLQYNLNNSESQRIILKLKNLYFCHSPICRCVYA